MKIEAVVTCCNYGDFLAHSLPHNRTLFDRIIVVTAPEDKATQKVCEYWNVECVRTDKFQSHWGQFHKGAGINAGLERLDRDGWLVHMDSDIVLPPLSRRFLEMADLDRGYLYGADRFMCASFEEWIRFVSKPRLLHENKSWVHMDTFPMGVRVAMEQFGGYLPIGFFQMWHGSTGIVKYPDDHTSAARSDTAFAAQWPRNRRALLPEVVAYHLESEKSPMGANWNGRQTKPFTGAGGQDPLPYN